MELVADWAYEHSAGDSAKACRALDNRIEHGLHIRGRTRDRPQDLARGGLLVERLGDSGAETVAFHFKPLPRGLRAFQSPLEARDLAFELCLRHPLLTSVLGLRWP